MTLAAAVLPALMVLWPGPGGAEPARPSAATVNGSQPEAVAAPAAPSPGAADSESSPLLNTLLTPLRLPRVPSLMEMWVAFLRDSLARCDSS